MILPFWLTGSYLLSWMWLNFGLVLSCTGSHSTFCSRLSFCSTLEFLHLGAPKSFTRPWLDLCLRLILSRTGRLIKLWTTPPRPHPPLLRSKFLAPNAAFRLYSELCTTIRSFHYLLYIYLEKWASCSTRSFQNPHSQTGRPLPGRWDCIWFSPVILLSNQGRLPLSKSV